MRIFSGYQLAAAAEFLNLELSMEILLQSSSSSANDGLENSNTAAPTIIKRSKIIS